MGDYCDTPRCRVPVIVGMVLALFIGMCFCKAVKCIFYYLCCCRCCNRKKDESGEYQGLSTDADEIEMTNGFHDEPDSDEEPSARSGKKKGGGGGYRDRVM